MNLRRLLNANIQEIASRSWQELWRHFDRLAAAGDLYRHRSYRLFEHLSPHPALAGGGALHGSAEPAMLQVPSSGYLQRAGSGHFFAGVMSEQTPELFATQLPAAREKVIAAAGVFGQDLVAA